MWMRENFPSLRISLAASRRTPAPQRIEYSPAEDLTGMRLFFIRQNAAFSGTTHFSTQCGPIPTSHLSAGESSGRLPASVRSFSKVRHNQAENEEGESSYEKQENVDRFVE